MALVSGSAAERSAASATRIDTSGPSPLARSWAAWQPSVRLGVVLFLSFKLVTELMAVAFNYGSRIFGILPVRPAALMYPWNQWDAGWYKDIAEKGYARLVAVSENGKVYDATGFPPLYPTMIRGLRHLGMHSLAAAMLVSSVALLLALVVMVRLVTLELGETRGRVAMALLLCGPTAFFLAAPYTEPMQLLFLGGAFLSARQKRWWLAGVALGLGGITKPYLLIALLPILGLYLADRGWSLRRLDHRVALLVVPAVAPLGLWMLYLYRRFHDPLKFIHALAGWRDTTGPPWVPVGNAVGDLFSLRYIRNPLFGPSVVDLLALLVIGGMGIYLLSRRNWTYGATLVIVCLAIAAAGGSAPLWLGSADRYFGTWFPVVIAMVLLARRRLWALAPVFAVFLVTQTWLMSRFVTGQWAG